ncbi:hypothetical protein [Xanthocytophaga flava]|nr:hypothetical protein [Xanthocytophaga flavus]
MAKCMVAIFIGFMLLIAGCQQETKDTDASKTNVQTTLDTTKAKLAKLINLSVFKPTHVKYHYTFIDNSGQNERLSVPGPSDSYLQAVLYFDTVTFDSLQKRYHTIEYTSPGYTFQEFDFDWLDATAKEELHKSDTSYHGHRDYFFGLGPTGKLWFLNNKVLLMKSSN